MLPPSVCAVRFRALTDDSVNSTRPFTCASVGSPGPIAIPLPANWKLPATCDASMRRQRQVEMERQARAALAAPAVGEPVDEPAHRALRR